MVVPFHNPSNTRLQIEGAPAGLPNDFPDPDGAQGTWTLAAGVDARYLDILSDGTKFTITSVTGAADGLASVVSPMMPAIAGDYYRHRYDVTAITAGNKVVFTIAFFDANKNAISVTPPGLSGSGSVAGGVGTNYGAAVQAPAGTAYVRLNWTQVVVASGANAAVGSTASMNRLMLTHGSSAAVAGNFAFTPHVTWIDVLNKSTTVTVDRAALDLGTLSATVLDSTLDPATTDTITPGRAVRLQALIAGTWEDVFTGTIDDADVVYTKNRVGAEATTITISAIDAASALANTPQARGVATLAQLPWIMEFYAQVPWKINGNASHVRNPSNAQPVSQNPDASLLDQIGITRDSVSGYAWVDRHGVLVAYDSGSMPAGTLCTFSDVANAGATFDGYSAIAVGWNTDDVINQVTVNWLRQTGAGAASEEIPYGPYVDTASVQKYRARSRTFTMHGTNESGATIAAFAAAVIAANKTPVRKASSLTLPVRDARSHGHAATLDLYDKVAVVYGTKLNTTYRITSIKHEISPEDGWLTTYGYGIAGQIAAPSSPPSPAASSNTTDGQWINVGDPGAPAFQNGWTNYGAGYVPTRFMRKSGIVYVQMTAKAGTVSVAIFTLPPGYRPSSTISPTPGNGNGTNSAIILNDGRVIVTTPAGGTAGLVVDFPADV